MGLRTGARIMETPRKIEIREPLISYAQDLEGLVRLASICHHGEGRNVAVLLPQKSTDGQRFYN